MTLAPGTNLGPYQIDALLGAGGMGEVYRATDPRVPRTVAIKVLPAEVSDDPARRARFEREARAIGSLNHPHICTLFDVGEHEGHGFLVMELVEGETLATRLQRGAFPLDDALRYASEIASALDRAHRHGIVHRDLKPANVMITKTGVKLLDFGLAKFTLGPFSQESALPTRLADGTAEGTILGTLQYMSPEQLEGREVDARSDVFAFGAVLYEMVTGRKAFEGKSQASLISSILRDQPPAIAALQPLAPAALDRVVRTCLEKDPDDRWQSARDLDRALRWLADEGEETKHPLPTTKDSGAGRIWRSAAWVGIGLVLASLAIWLWGSPARGPATAMVTHLQVPLTPAEALRGGQPGETTAGMGRPSRNVLALSPDGRLLVFGGVRASVQRLFVRALDRGDEARAIAGTEGADTPFFSPDGRWIGFWTQTKQKLSKVAIDGGPVVDVCSTPNALFGASWGAGDVIVFGTARGLMKVSAAGGEPADLMPPSRFAAMSPQILPGGEGVIYSAVQSAFFADVSVSVLSLKTGRSQVLIEDAADARYVSHTGHLVFAKAGTLMAAPFDVPSLRLSGGAVSVVDSVLQALNGRNNFFRTGAAQFAFSDTGVLAYVTGGIYQDRTNHLELIDLDRASGEPEILAAPPKGYIAPRFSPDGQRVAVATTGTASGVWVYDRERGDLRQVPFKGRANVVLWTPGGDRVVFSGYGKNVPFELYSVPADGSAPAQQLSANEEGRGPVPASWTPEGDLIFVGSTEETSNDIMVLSLKDHMVRSLLASPSDEAFPALSPDGHWLAYSSNESSAQREVYLRPYPAVDTKRISVSTHGGTAPRWVRNGKALLYWETGQPTGRVMSVEITGAPALGVSMPHVVWEGRPDRLTTPSSVSGFDVTPDGRRLLWATLEDPTPPAPTIINVVINWFDELRARVPVGR